MAQILISNFGDPDVNGLYTQNGNHDGYPFYEKNTGDYIVIYKLENGPYSYAPAYWIEKVARTNGSVEFFNPKYKATDTTNALTATWTSVVENTSGEETVGAFIDSSSSSSSEEYSSSSSSSSIDSSSSSS